MVCRPSIEVLDGEGEVLVVCNSVLVVLSNETLGVKEGVEGVH